MHQTLVTCFPSYSPIENMVLVHRLGSWRVTLTTMQEQNLVAQMQHMQDILLVYLQNHESLKEELRLYLRHRLEVDKS